jgi:molecular chaperone Hsp33
MKSSSDQPSPLSSDVSQRFLFDNADIRGETVHLGAAFEDILAIHRYSPGVNQLLGEFLAAAVLLSTTLKFEGKLILQARSSGQIPLIMVECTNELHVRAIVRGAEQASSTDFSQLLNTGQLAITIDPRDGQRYQSIVPLSENSLAESLDAYFEQSEQLATRFWLHADQHQAAGMLLQQLPTQTVNDKSQREEQWQHARALADTIKADELLNLQAPELLHRLYHETPVRLFEPTKVKFQCSCSRDRTLAALATIDQAELKDILKEQGEITLVCEFCKRQYGYNKEDIAPLLALQIPAPESTTLH